MRRLAAVFVIAFSLLGPATAAHADPGPDPPERANVLWPVCTIVGQIGICIPP